MPMQHPDNLRHLRDQIDSLNVELVELINQRAEVAIQIGKLKKDRPIYDPVREATVLKQVVARNAGPLSDAALKAIFQEIITACRAIQQPLRVAYLGPEGTYCQQAALQYYGIGNTFVPCSTIDEVVQIAETGSTNVAVVPVENSNEGSVNRTLDLLLDTSLSIIGEVALPIHHQLLSHAPNLEAIAKVVAHPQALAQCHLWLARHLPTAAQVSTTSNGAAAHIAANDTATAAIAGTQAATYYHLPILANNIEDTSNNTTRFLILGTIPPDATGNDKTSLICSAPHAPGALRDLLEIFADEAINIVKLESRPAIHALWEYVFYIDIEGHQNDPSIAYALNELRQAATFVKIIGSYPKGAH